MSTHAIIGVENPHTGEIVCSHVFWDGYPADPEAKHKEEGLGVKLLAYFNSRNQAEALVCKPAIVQIMADGKVNYDNTNYRSHFSRTHWNRAALETRFRCEDGEWGYLYTRNNEWVTWWGDAPSLLTKEILYEPLTVTVEQYPIRYKTYHESCNQESRAA